MSGIIRLAEAADAAAIQAIYAPIVEDTIISFELEPPPVDEIHQRIEKIVPRFPWLVCVRDGDFLGYAYASAHRERAAYQWGVDVSAYISEKWRRAGIGRALYTALFGILRAQGFYNAYAGIALPNAGSVGLHEAMGFTPVGVYRQVGYKLGGWHDVGWWELQLQPRINPPDFPLPLAQVIDSEAWRAAIAEGINLLRG